MHGLTPATNSASARQRGAAAVIMALSMSLLAGTAALAIDLGSARSTHRGLTTVSDAAALAAAETYADGGDGCAAAISLIQQNAPDATPSCSNDASASVVSVSATKPVGFIMAGAIGIADRTVSSTTQASYGSEGARGVRPFAMCVNYLYSIPAIQAWDQETPLGPVTIDFSGQAQTNACGGSAGNWGSVDFNGGSNPAWEQADWIENGYNGEVYPGWYEGDPGNNAFNGGPVQAAMNSLIGGDPFPVAVFDSASGSGNNSQLQVVGFANIVLESHNFQASAAEITVTFHPAEDGWPGIECCNPAGPVNDGIIVGICGFESDVEGC